MPCLIVNMRKKEKIYTYLNILKLLDSLFITSFPAYLTMYYKNSEVVDFYSFQSAVRLFPSFLKKEGSNEQEL